jgi:hypothetical protein
MIIDDWGNQIWYNERGQYHRTDGPAFVEANGSYGWYINGKCHRTDGPAFVDESDSTQYWFINDKRKTKNKSYQKAAKLSDEDMTAIVLKYGGVK